MMLDGTTCSSQTGLLKGNPTPPGDCRLDGLQIAGGIIAHVAIHFP